MLGICNGPRLVTQGLGSLKRDLLFFDKLVLLGGQQLIISLRAGPSKRNYRRLADEVEYLLETSFFAASSSSKVVYDIHLPNESLQSDSFQQAKLWYWQIEEVRNRLKAESQQKRSQRLRQKLTSLRDMQISLITRLEAERLNDEGQLATSNEYLPIDILGKPFTACAGDVIQLSIKSVPLPDDGVAWEDIFALRMDQEVVDRARKLRLWAIDQAQSDMPLSHLEEKIADLLADYERSLKAHKVKYKSSTMRSIVVGAAGVLEDLAKLRLEKATDRFFSLRTSKADMLLAEASAPGRELSLVTLLREKLAKR